MNRTEGECQEGMTHAEELVAAYNLGASIEREGFTEYLEEIAWENSKNRALVRMIHEVIIPWFEERVA